MGATGSDDPGFARDIARFAAALDERVLTSAVVDAIKVRIVDTIGCMRGAAGAEPVQRALAMALRYGGRAAGEVPGASVVGSPSLLPVEAAALVNGIAARYLDFNDIYLSKEGVHPSDNLAVALALAQALRRDGRALALAAVRGYEVHCRLADTLTTRKGGWDNVVLGAIAASVMAGSLLELDAQAQANAINIAAVGNVALMQTRVGSLSMWKGIAAAYAARAGLFAAIAASEGIGGPGRALDGSHGLFARVTGTPEPGAFAATGDPPRLFDTHLKAYPSQYFTQTAIDAALAVRTRVRVGDIRRIEVATFEFGRVAAADTRDKWHPATRETADHSMPYCVAVALLDGAVSEEQFAAERIAGEDVRRLMGTIEVVEDPGFTAQYPGKVPTRIVVEHRDASRVEERVDYPSGHSRNPMPRERVEGKFLSLAGGGHRRVLERLWQLEALPASAAASLVRDAIGDPAI